jgi:hypothetical protein
MLYNSPMSRWVKFALAILVGLALGLVYGWIINPVEYTNTAPDTLRADYRSDYVLMVAEIYHADQNLDLAARRLAMLGSDDPSVIASQALEYALDNTFPTADIALLQELSAALLTWQPAPAGGTP